jgi:hypothetical protein
MGNVDSKFQLLNVQVKQLKHTYCQGDEAESALWSATSRVVS